MINIINPFIKIAIILILLFSITGCKEKLSTQNDYNITCYAATYGKGIYKSNNGGKSWFSLDMNQEEIHAYFKRIYLNPKNNNILFVTTTGAGLFEIDLKNQSINPVRQLKDYNLTSLAFKRSNVDITESWDIFFGTYERGIIKYNPNKHNFDTYNKELNYWDVNIILLHNRDFYAGTVKDLFRWNESSNQWIPISSGIENKNIVSLDFESQNNILYAGSGLYESKRRLLQNIPCLYKSLNQGESWVASDKGIPDGTLVYVIKANPKQPERIYAGTSNGIFISSDGGLNWQRMKIGLPKSMKIIDIKIARVNNGNDVVYAAGSRGVYMTKDDDRTSWEEKSYGLPQTMITSILVLPE